MIIGGILVWIESLVVVKVVNGVSLDGFIIIV